MVRRRPATASLKFGWVGAHESMILNIISLLSSQLQSTVMKWLEVSKTKVILEIGIAST
jgi:hypothetical protein